MEDRSTIREQHGVANARKVASASIENSDTQAVTVTDGLAGEVLLSLSTSSYPAALTPDQAMKIAAMLMTSAKRVKQQAISDAIAKATGA